VYSQASKRELNGYRLIHPEAGVAPLNWVSHDPVIRPGRGARHVLRIDNGFVKQQLKLVDGHPMLCLMDQSAPDLDIAAIEKRRCNRVLVNHLSFSSGLDAFAGVGVSAAYWSRSCARLTLVENRKDAFRILKRNLLELRNTKCKHELIFGDARIFMERAISEGRQFDLVDCDPFGSRYDLLELIPRLMPHGILCITSGEIYQVYRGLNRRPGRPDAHGYKGRRAVMWVQESLLPEILSHFREARLLHLYAFPTSVRIYLAIGNTRADAEWFRGRPQRLGWFAESARR
jgi:hypothetical protein